MKPNISILLILGHNLGNHFLTWSLSYLNNMNEYHNLNNVVAPLPDNPLTSDSKNVHLLVQSPVIRGYEHLKNYIENITCDIRYINIPVSPIHIEQVLTKYPEINISNISNISNKQHKLINEYIAYDLNQIISYVSKQEYPISCIEYNKRDVLSVFYNNRKHVSYKSMNIESGYNNMHEYMNAYEKDFFNSSSKMFDTEYIWDIREKYALNIMPFNINTNISKSLDISQAQCNDSIDIYDNLDQTIYDIANHHNIIINKARYNQWKLIYKKWKIYHDTKFSRDFWKIIDFIWFKQNVDLSIYKIDFFKEVLILYGLMYKYNVNFKSWGLDKLPQNTYDLSLLLEPNIHDRPKHFDDSYHFPEFNYY